MAIYCKDETDVGKPIGSMLQDKKRAISKSALRKALHLCDSIGKLCPRGRIVLFINNTDSQGDWVIDGLERNDDAAIGLEIDSKAFASIHCIESGNNKNYKELTRKEHTILECIARGKTNMEIAYALKVSEQTIKSHVSSILRKLDAHDRAHSVYLGVLNGLLEADSA